MTPYPMLHFFTGYSIVCSKPVSPHRRTQIAFNPSKQNKPSRKKGVREQLHHWRKSIREAQSLLPRPHTTHCTLSKMRLLSGVWPGMSSPIVPHNPVAVATEQHVRGQWIFVVVGYLSVDPMRCRRLTSGFFRLTLPDGMPCIWW